MIRFDIEPGSDEWHAARRLGIGGSEIAGLFRAETRSYGFGEFLLYHVKGGGPVEAAPFRDNERAALGRAMEPGIVALAAEREGWTVQRGAYAICDDQPTIRASLDGIADHIPSRLLDVPAWEMVSGPGVLEAKNVSGETMREDFGWNPREPRRPTPPRRMTLQLQHGMLAAGLQWGALCILFQGENLQVYCYPAQLGVHAMIRAKVAALYQRIADGDEPLPDSNTETERAIKSTWRESNGYSVRVPHNRADEFDEFCLLRDAAEAQRKHWDDQAHLYDNRVRHILGMNEVMTGNEWTAILRPDKNGNRRRLIVRRNSNNAFDRQTGEIA